jgi:hypothetical protein
LHHPKKDTNGTLENRLWESADQFRAKLEKVGAKGGGTGTACGAARAWMTRRRNTPIVAPMIRVSQVLQRQIQNLRWTRVLLLPASAVGAGGTRNKLTHEKAILQIQAETHAGEWRDKGD